MDDTASPERSGGEQAAVPANSSVPAMPVIRPSEQSTNPYPVAEGLSRTIGWQFRPDRRGVLSSSSWAVARWVSRKCLSVSR